MLVSVRERKFFWYQACISTAVRPLREYSVIVVVVMLCLVQSVHQSVLGQDAEPQIPLPPMYEYGYDTEH